MNHKTSPLNGDFGVMIEGVSRADISDPAFQRQAFDLWTEHGGLLAVRGDDLADTSPEELMAWSEVFGAVEHGNFVAREDKMVQGFPILRIGNIRDETGKLKASLARVPQLRTDAGFARSRAPRLPGRNDPAPPARLPRPLAGWRRWSCSGRRAPARR